MIDKKHLFLLSIYFLLIPSLLISIFIFSDSLNQILSLYTNNPTILSIIGSNYLHADIPHLASNLFAYFLVVPFIFYFDYKTNRKMLTANLLLLFVLLPVVNSLVNIISFAEYDINLPMKGFSAIAAGFFGYLAYSLLHFIREQYKVKFKRSIFQLMWLILFINLALISLIYGYLIVAIVIGVLIVLNVYNTTDDFKEILNLLSRLDFFNRPILLGGFLFSMLFVVFGLFPVNLQQGTSLVNIYAHYVGYIFGFFVPAIISEYLLEG